jgi:hypothetical protein
LAHQFHSPSRAPQRISSGDVSRIEMMPTGPRQPLPPTNRSIWWTPPAAENSSN